MAKKIDTIYYLVDTIKLANNKTIEISLENGGYVKDFEFNSPCLVNHIKPVFSYGINSVGKYLTKAGLKKLKLTCTDNLIKLLCQDNRGRLYSEQYVTFFIEPEGSHYIQHKVWSPGVTTVN